MSPPALKKRGARESLMLAFRTLAVGRSSACSLVAGIAPSCRYSEKPGGMRVMQDLDRPLHSLQFANVCVCVWSLRSCPNSSPTHTLEPSPNAAVALILHP
jgi:hypothetical protein